MSTGADTDHRRRMPVQVADEGASSRVTSSSQRGGRRVLAVDDAFGAGGEPESPFEEAVIRTLHSLGPHVVAQVGRAGYRRAAPEE